MQLTTLRLRLRQPTRRDAAFLLQLLNDPGFLRFIGDRQVRTLAEAETYLQQRILASFQQHGFGLWLAERRSDGQTVGLCGLVLRDYLPCPDLGYALLTPYCGLGYGTELASAVVAYSEQSLQLPSICAIVTPDNQASRQLLQKVGMQWQRQIQPPDTEEWLDLYQLNLTASG
jgi:RimJ/RimL family protein N-acetyltransferase